MLCGILLDNQFFHENFIDRSYILDIGSIAIWQRIIWQGIHIAYKN